MRRSFGSCVIGKSINVIIFFNIYKYIWEVPVDRPVTAWWKFGVSGWRSLRPSQRDLIVIRSSLRGGAGCYRVIIIIIMTRSGGSQSVVAKVAHSDQSRSTDPALRPSSSSTLQLLGLVLRTMSHDHFASRGVWKHWEY